MYAINLTARTALWTLHTCSAATCPLMASLWSMMSRNVSIFLIFLRIITREGITSPINRLISRGNTPLPECSLMVELESMLLHLSHSLSSGTYLPSDWSLVARKLHPLQQSLYLILNILRSSRLGRGIALVLKYSEFLNITFLIRLIEIQCQEEEYRSSFKSVAWWLDPIPMAN